MPTYSELKTKLLDYAYQTNVLITAEFEITSSCNFNCEMCYAKKQNSQLTTKQWFDIFNMAYENGMLFALLTGGEIFSRPDFIKLYNHLYDLGVKITLFTNGSKLNDKILEALKKRPPEVIAITLYGYDESSYQDFTKTKAFKDVDQAIDKIINSNLNLTLRTIPLPKIYQNLDKIIAYVKSKNLHLGYFLYVSQTNDSFKRLSPKELLDFESQIKSAFPTNVTNTDSKKCSAFISSYFINHQGYMQGCAMMPKPTKKVGDDLLGTFLELKKQWDELIKNSPCKNCELEQNCMNCVARRYLEGNVLKCSAYLKAIAEEKQNA
ncbi:MAG: radical SAM protein [Candidatus Izemoplasmatales bacterium]